MNVNDKNIVQRLLTKTGQLALPAGETAAPVEVRRLGAKMLAASGVALAVTGAAVAEAVQRADQVSQAEHGLTATYQAPHPTDRVSSGGQEYVVTTSPQDHVGLEVPTGSSSASGH